MSNLHFDPYQFAGAGRGAYAASAETNISFNDYGRMHTETHRGFHPWCPPFALNDSQLQQVLLLRGWRYIHGHGIPAAADRDKINQRATALALRGNVVGAGAPRIQHEIVQKHKAAVRKAGGFLQLHSAIAFRSWRLGMDSVAVAETLDMTPVAVRQALWRMRDNAKRLGFDAGCAGYTAGTKRKPPKPLKPLKPQRKPQRNPKVDVAKAAQLRKEGNSLRTIAREFGVSHAAIYFALRRGGAK